MAANLCCTADQQGRPDSPELPNARIRNTAAANLPLLPNQPRSPNSRFTSARTDELIELQHIFEGVREHGLDQASPARKPRPRFSRTSIYSLHNLHKMTSMRSIIKRKFSKEPVKKDSSKLQDARVVQDVDVDDQNTVVRQPKGQADGQLRITKQDLRKDLLSDRGPEEGGYDADAEVLDDVARNVGKKASGKRRSVHSINWSVSTGSKPTPASSTRAECDAKSNARVQPYDIRKPRVISFSTRVSHIFSTPNLRAEFPNEKDHSLRRSQSATSMGLPKVSPLSPLRLPSLASYNKDGRSWAEILEESLQLPQFPVPPRSPDMRTSETVLHIERNLASDPRLNQPTESDTAFLSQTAEGNVSEQSRRDPEIDEQLPAPAASDQPPESIRGAHENTQPSTDTKDSHEFGIDNKDEDEDSRQSIHLHSMRISHHLRSGSLLSWDQLGERSEPSSPSLQFRQRATSDQSQISHIDTQLIRCERKASSSGFASTRMPSRWGRVVYPDLNSPGDVASSIYSSRPHSPPDSLRGSMANLSPNATGYVGLKNSSPQLPEHRRSSSFPTDDEETPRPLYRHGRAITVSANDKLPASDPVIPEVRLARKNSTADTKKSKFREEFGQPSLQKKTTPTASLWKLLTPKRLSIHSQSDSSLNSIPSIRSGDGSFDALPLPVARERRQSRSLMSLNTEHDALKRTKKTDQVKGPDNVWNKALEAHQKEKALLFLPQNQQLAVRASPFRARSGSVSPFLRSNDAGTNTRVSANGISRRPSTMVLDVEASNMRERSLSPAIVTRRSAITSQEDESSDPDLSIIFNTQGDSVDVVGAWGKFPSHTRSERCASAGKSDQVESRDFALEAAVRVAPIQETNANDEELDPVERLPSLPLLPGQKKRKKKVGSGRMVKSTSMTFGKTFLKNYSRIFKSQSTDFRRHGRNHRSSITTGGVLEFPELELLPEVWAGRTSQEDSREEQSSQGDEIGAKETSKLETEDSSSTLRPRRYSDIPNLSEQVFLDGAADIENGPDRARAWSAFYGTCMPAISRLNSEADLGVGMRNVISDLSHPRRPSSTRSRTLPASPVKHTRNASNVSGTSAISQRSVLPKFIAPGEKNVTFEERSIFSVRRSTMDLMLKFKEQEITEHDKVLSFTRTQSRRNTIDTRTL